MHAKLIEIYNETEFCPLFLKESCPKIIPMHSSELLDFFSEMKDVIYKKEKRLSGCHLGSSNLKDLIFTKLF